MEEVLTYTVLSHLRHDHTSYHAGDTVELTKSQAAPLIEIGVVTPAEPVEASEGKPGKLSKSALGKMKVAALQDYARANNVSLPDGATKDQIVAAILGEGLDAE